MPIHLQPKVKIKLEKLLNEGHIEKLTNCSDQFFISPIVITVKKDQSIKIALDSKILNKAFFYFLRSVFRQSELPPSHKFMYWWYWQHFSLQFQSQFQRRWQKTSINWCLRKPLVPPLCPCSMLPMLLQLSRWLKTTAKIAAKTLTLFSNNVKLRRALLTND